MSSRLRSIEETVQRQLDDHGLTDRKRPVVVAVSGGIDSVVVAHAVHALGYRVVLAHVHHGLRGKDADRDAQLVEEMAREWNCPVHVVEIGDDLNEPSSGESMQDRARRLRYAGLEHVAREVGSEVIITGHHRDDQAETVLLQLLRGTGPDGLAGMPAVRFLSTDSPVRLLRPLLSQSRDRIRAYAETAGLAWREDRSNESDVYLRNAVRRRVLPLLDDVAGGESADRIARAAELLRQYLDSDLDALTEALLRGACRPLPGGGVLIEERVLEPLPEVWKGRLILSALEQHLPAATRSRATVDRALELLLRQTGRSVPLEGGAMWRERGGLALVPERPLPPPASLAVAAPVEWDGTLFRLDPVSGPYTEDGPGGVILDADRLPPALTIRAWSAGDRLQPRGMSGSRKVKDLLVDARVAAHSRARSPVVATGVDVVWVVGIRADRRFVADSGTANRVRLSASHSG
jgi:tRNA(Ile)-lysidine synthase